MTRSIAILTLALTAAVSADETFAQGFRPVPNPVVWMVTKSVDKASPLLMVSAFTLDGKGADVVTEEFHVAGSGTDLYLCETSHNLYLSVEGIGCHFPAHNLIAIIAFKSGPEVAYEMLLDAGFRPEEADDIVIEAMSIFSFEFQELTLLQFNPREYTFTK